MFAGVARNATWFRLRLPAGVGAHSVVLAGIVAGALLLYAYSATSFGHTFHTVDGYLYYTHAHSWYFDGDCDYENNMRLAPGFAACEHFLQRSPGGGGRVRNVLPCAWSVIALPFVAIADLMTVMHNAILGTAIARDGYTGYYRAIVPLAHVLAGIVGLLITYALVARYFQKTIAAVATAVVWCGTNVIYFVSVDPTMVHGTSMAFVSGTIWMCDTIRRGGWSAKRAVGLGLCCGMMVAVRYQNIAWMVVPLILLTPSLVVGLARGRPGSGRDTWLVVPAVVAAALCFVPQIIVNLSSEGAIVGHVSHWTPHWFELRFDRELFAESTGLLTVYPLTALCLIGIFVYLCRNRGSVLTPAMLAGFVAILYVNSCWPWAHSPRRYVCAMAVFTFGLAAILEWAAQSPRRTVGVGLVLGALCARSVTMLFDADAMFV